jgi:hypothetical protein
MKRKAQSLRRCSGVRHHSLNKTRERDQRKVREAHYRLTTDAQRSHFLDEVNTSGLNLRQVPLEATVGRPQVQDQLQHRQEHRQAVSARRQNKQEGEDSENTTDERCRCPESSGFPADKSAPTLSWVVCGCVDTNSEHAPEEFLGGTAINTPNRWPDLSP